MVGPGLKFPPFIGDPYTINTGFKVNQTPKPVKGFSKKHPFNNKDNHQKLLMHIKNRLDLSRQLRDELNIRLKNIDMDLTAFVKLSDDDRNRQLQNRRGLSRKPVDVSLPLAIAKLDDLLTFMMEVFFPNSEGMFGAESTAKNQQIANSFAQELNDQGKMRGYYHKVARFVWDVLKYNVGVIGVEWTVEKGFKLGNDAAKRLKISKDEVLFEGNDIFNVDLYNFFYDPTVQYLSELPSKGEWMAYSRMYTRFAIQKMAIAGDLQGVENWIATSTPQTTSLYYAERPVVRFDYNANTGSVDWVKFAAGDMYKTVGWGVELVTMYVWINPSMFGLSDDDELQIWRLCLANGMWICHATKLDAAHNMLPMLVANMLEDNLGLQRKSAGETQLDFNNFASFLMNLHQQAARSKLNGLTVYDPSALDLKSLGDDASGRVPLLPGGYGKDIRTIIQRFSDAPDTAKTTEDIKAVIDLMEYTLPTNQQRQVADLDRATTYQAAATVQGTNRRSLKGAKIIDDQALSKLRMIMMWNTLQYKDQINMIDDMGNRTPVPTAQFREQGLEFDTGEGIQSIDRIMLVHLLHDIINALLQSEEAQKQIDLVGLIDYWIKLFGTKISISQFRFQQAPNPGVKANDQHQQDMQNQQTDNATKVLGALGDLGASGGTGETPEGLQGLIGQQPQGNA